MVKTLIKLKEANIVIFVYDCQNQRSLSALSDYWITEVKKRLDENCGNNKYLN